MTDNAICYWIPGLEGIDVYDLIGITPERQYDQATLLRYTYQICDVLWRRQPYQYFPYKTWDIEPLVRLLEKEDTVEDFYKAPAFEIRWKIRDGQELLTVWSWNDHGTRVEADLQKLPPNLIENGMEEYWYEEEQYELPSKVRRFPIITDEGTPDRWKWFDEDYLSEDDSSDDCPYDEHIRKVIDETAGVIRERVAQALGDETKDTAEALQESINTTPIKSESDATINPASLETTARHRLWCCVQFMLKTMLHIIVHMLIQLHVWTITRAMSDSQSPIPVIISVGIASATVIWNLYS